MPYIMKAIFLEFVLAVVDIALPKYGFLRVPVFHRRKFQTTAFEG
jgi:hypothetical protein